MARLHDGRITVHLTLHMRWWVKPYLFAVALFLKSIAAFIDRQVAFIANRGFRFYCNGRRV
jgi:hypothetical protein